MLAVNIVTVVNNRKTCDCGIVAVMFRSVSTTVAALLEECDGYKYVQEVGFPEMVTTCSGLDVTVTRSDRTFIPECFILQAPASDLHQTPRSVNYPGAHLQAL